MPREKARTTLLRGLEPAALGSRPDAEHETAVQPLQSTLGQEPHTAEIGSRMMDLH